MAISECARDLFFRRLEEEGAKGDIRDASVAGVGAFVSDAIDSVDNKSVGGSEVGGERSGLELAEAVATGEVTAKVDVVGEGSLLHKGEECADGGIG